MNIRTNVHTLDRAMTIIDFLLEEGPARGRIIAEETGLPHATALRLIAALRAHGLIDIDRNLNYMATGRVKKARR